MLGTAPVRRSHCEQSQPEQLPAALTASGTRVLRLRQDCAPVHDTGPARLAWADVASEAAETLIADLSATPDEPPPGVIHLGYDDGAAILLDLGSGISQPPPASFRWAGLREIGADLPPEEATWFIIALALSSFHRDHAHCPGCGQPTRPILLGWARRCPEEQREIFPRTDPAIIAAVTHTDAEGTERILLGRSTRWPAGRFSAFAGFVEAGESLEAAVAREVEEEAGVVVEEVCYRGSQPWPFPRSLMLGFRAVVTRPETARADGTEIAQVRWFTRQELCDAVHSAEVTLPGKVSIAHHLLREWYGAPLPELTKG